MPDLNYKLNIDPEMLKSQRGILEGAINFLEEKDFPDSAMQGIYGIRNIIDEIADQMVDIHGYKDGDVYNFEEDISDHLDYSDTASPAVDGNQEKEDLYLVMHPKLVQRRYGIVGNKKGLIVTSAVENTPDQLRETLMSRINLERFNVIDCIRKPAPDLFKKALDNVDMNWDCF